MQRDELVDELKDLAEENWAYGRTRTAKALEQAAAELTRLRAQVPEGFVLVPRKANGKMIHAAVRVWDSSSAPDPEQLQVASETWNAMLAAAPPAPSGGCVRHECKRVREEMQAEIDRLRIAPDRPSGEAVSRAIKHALSVSVGGQYNWADYMCDLWRIMHDEAPAPVKQEGVDDAPAKVDGWEALADQDDADLEAYLGDRP